MRILLTADPIGGVWTYALELAAGLRRRGDEVLLAVLGGEPRFAQRVQAERAGIGDLRARALALEWMENPWRDVDAGGEWLLELAEEFRPDVVHLNQMAYGHLQWRAPVVTVAHSCVRSWWRAVRAEPVPSRYAEYGRRVRRGLGASDAVVAPTRSFLAEVERRYGPLADARAILNGRSPTLRPSGTKEELVLSAGRLWDDAKNVAALERVAPRLRWPVLVAGESRGPGGGIRLRSAHALGPLDPAELRAWMARAAVFALPARYEPFGLAPLEAAQAGCALVLGDIPTLREVWGPAASYADPEDDDAIAAAVAGLLDDAGRRARMAALAMRRAAELSATAMVRAYRRLYAELAGRHGGTRAEPTPTLRPEEAWTAR